jgi:FtsP/CotA-like multicopper oxidase with cupredoxin domain
MSPRGPMMGMLGGGTSWAITRDIAGRTQSAQGTKPILTVARGRTCVLTLKNNTSWWHPMHLRGFSFRVLTRNGIPVRRTCMTLCWWSPMKLRISPLAQTIRATGCYIVM